MLLIARNAERRKSCSNYNLKRVQQPFGFAPAAAFPLMFRHCLLSSRHKQQKYDYVSYGVISPRQQEVRPVFRDSGSARPTAGLRFPERPTRSRDPAQFQKQDLALTARGRWF